MVIRKSKVRRHGLERPFAPLQVLGWLFGTFIGISFTVMLATLIVEEKADVTTIVLASLYYLFFIALVVTTILVTASDPSDPAVYLERAHRKAQQDADGLQVPFDEDQFQYFCEVCDGHVLSNTKHCQKCNRCTHEFDHHCRWVSNDIGLSNYHMFIRMLVALLATVLIQIAFIVRNLVRLELEDGSLRDSAVGFIKRNEFKVLNWCALAVCIILLTLNGYLFSYHVYLICRNISTYKHIRM